VVVQYARLDALPPGRGRFPEQVLGMGAEVGGGEAAPQPVPFEGISGVVLFFGVYWIILISELVDERFSAC
ncbi:hypothetical protein, partial [uncultured Bilophila sp.]|uniref:hypothetical protein n=1 Tax=uncultured Bilophila sp. TaxID=529385 RepID=UPI00280BEE2E